MPWAWVILPERGCHRRVVAPSVVSAAHFEMPVLGQAGNADAAMQASVPEFNMRSRHDGMSSVTNLAMRYSYSWKRPVEGPGVQ